MSDRSYRYASVNELHAAYRDGGTTPTTMLEEFYAHADELQNSVNALAGRLPESARREALESDEKWKNDAPRSVLEGVVVTVKDSIDIAGKTSRFGTNATSTRLAATRDAILIERLKNAGAVIPARTTATDFNMGINSVSSLYGITRNPWDLSASSGGSSSGAGAALAAGLGTVSVGTDLAGSVRIPASRCGLVALKPTQGSIAHLPTNPIRSPGAMGRTVNDVAQLHRIISGHHYLDTASLPGPAFTWDEDELDLAGLRIGICTNFGAGPSAENPVIEACEAVGNQLERAGATVSRVPKIFDSDPSAALDRTFQARTLLERSRGTTEQGNQTLDYLKAWSDKATSLLASDYSKNLETVLAAQQEFVRAIHPFDFVLTPVTPTVRVEAGQAARDLEDPFADSNFVAWCNQSGNPAATVCAAFHEGLPVGVQIIGRRFNDVGVLKLARLIEQQRNFLMAWPFENPN